MGLFKKREKTKFVYDEEGNLVPVHYVEKKGEYVKVEPESEEKQQDKEKIKRWIKEDKREKAKLKAKNRARRRREWDEKKRRIAEIRRSSMVGAKRKPSVPRRSPAPPSKTKYVIQGGVAYPVAKVKSSKSKKSKKPSGLDLKDFKWPSMKDWKL